MRDRAACERRVYRLAALLSGNPTAAVRVIEAVVDAQPDLRELDSVRMDRLTVLRSREISPARIVDDRIPPAVAGALASLTAQQREAWVFVHIYLMPVRETAKAMDCSVTAITQHLKLAEDAMAQALKEHTLPLTQADAAALFRSWSMAIDVPAFFRREQARRRRVRMLLVVAAVVVAIAAIVGAIVFLPELLGRMAPPG